MRSRWRLSGWPGGSPVVGVCGDLDPSARSWFLLRGRCVFCCPGGQGCWRRERPGQRDLGSLVSRSRAALGLDGWVRLAGGREWGAVPSPVAHATRIIAHVWDLGWWRAPLLGAAGPAIAEEASRFEGIRSRVGERHGEQYGSLTWCWAAIVPRGRAPKP